MIEIANILDIENYVGGLEAIIFDLDDTLYSEKEYVRSGYRAVAEVLPGIEDAAGKLWRLFKDGKPAIDVLLEDEGIFTVELKHKCVNTYRKHIPDIHLYDGVSDMLCKLQKDYKIGLITDGRIDSQRAKIKALGIDKMIKDRIITDELGGVQFRKPCNISFRLLIDRWKIQAEKIVYVGDNPSKDFQAPKELGMKSIWYKNPNGLYSQGK